MKEKQNKKFRNFLATIKQEEDGKVELDYDERSSPKPSTSKQNEKKNKKR